MLFRSKVVQFSAVKNMLDIHPDAPIPSYNNQTIRRTFTYEETSESSYKVAIFATCYGDNNAPEIVNDLAAVLRHNKVNVTLLHKTQCCGMPKLELGDIQTAIAYAEKNKQPLLEAVNQGYKLMAPIPSCVLMFKNELPMILPKDEDIQAIARAFVDPFEYLDYLHDEGALNIAFKTEKTHVLYHMACHQRVQNIGAKTKKILNLLPNLNLRVASRCSGHDGTYGVKTASYEFAIKIGKPITRDIDDETDYILSDCVMAGKHIAHIHGNKVPAIHPISFMRQKYESGSQTSNEA